MVQSTNSKNNISGMTLLESLLSMSLGIFLLVGLLQVYLSTKSTWQLQQSLTLLQENGRFASYYLRQRVRMAGYSDCHYLADNQVNFVSGYSAEQMQTLLGGRLISGTDVLMLHECLTSKQTEQYMQVAYFVADTKRKNQAGHPVYALYEKKGDSPSQELIENVVNMQIQYGVFDDKQDTINYLPAEQVHDWSQVRSVDIMLLLNSVENVLTTSQPYWFAGQWQQSVDRRIYKSWEIYAALRRPE